MITYAVKKAQKLGAADAVARLSTEKRSQIRFANNSMTTLQNWETEKLELFLSFNKKIVSTSLDIVTKKSIDKAIVNLAKLAKAAKPKEDFGGIAQGPFKYKKIPGGYDRKILNCDLADKVEAAMNGALKKSQKTAGVLYASEEHTELATSGGVHTADKGTSIELSLRAFCAKDESGHALSCARTLNDFNPEAAGAKAALLASLAKSPAEGSPGKYDVLFDPMAFADLAGLTASFASAFYVESGFSFLADKLGREVASPAVSISDASDMAGGFGTECFDDEGVPTQTTDIVKRGILNTYLHNTSTARKYLVKTTANAGLINPAPRNVVLQPGNRSKDEILSGIRNGLCITNVWYTRFQNYRTGDFSTIPRDAILVIKDGELAGSVKNIRITENLEALLKKITAVSDRPEWVHWWEVQTPVYLPYVFAEKVNITKPTM
ncbi:MAG: TldD/PmbA family protein [Candidatus Aenigmatarchaeota archaeon]